MKTLVQILLFLALIQSRSLFAQNPSQGTLPPVVWSVDQDPPQNQACQTLGVFEYNPHNGYIWSCPKSTSVWTLIAPGGSNSNGYASVLSYGAKGDCSTDDTTALQNALNSQQFLFWPTPPGGCYLVSRTLTIQAGDYIFGQSGMIPNVGTPAGVVVRLKPNSNTEVFQTYVAPLGQGNEYMGLENIVIDGNGANQTTELPQGNACLDFRGGQILSEIKHVMVQNCFGTALLTGNAGGDTLLQTVWLYGASTSSYSWIHNYGISAGATAGTMFASQVFVEDQGTPLSGVFRNSTSAPNFGDPSTYSHAILMQAPQNVNLETIHCEGALTCIDVNNGQALNITGISGTRIGNPFDADPTNQFLIRIMSVTSLQHLTMSSAHFDQSGSNLPPSDFTATRILGLANGVTSNDWYQTPTNYTEWPFYTHGEYTAGGGVPYLGERSIVANEFWLQAIGSYSPNAIRMWDNAGAPSGTNWYWERGSSSMSFGFGPGPYQQNESNFINLNYFGSTVANNTVTIPGEQFILQSPDGTKSAVFQTDNTGNVKSSGGSTNFLWFAPNAYFGLTQGNNSTGAGINFQALNSDSYMIRGQFGSNIASNGSGSWNIGNQGGTDYASLFFSNGGGSCISASNSVTQPSTITDATYIGNAKTCVASSGNLLLNTVFNGTSHAPTDDGNSIQGAIVIETKQIKYTPVAFSTLAACSGTLEGSSAAITDSTTVVFNATVTGGGTNHIKVYCNGTNWVVD